MANLDVLKKWADRLDSGDYAQGQGGLHVLDREGNSEFCCLGVLCEIAVEEGVIPEPHRKVYGVDEEGNEIVANHYYYGNMDGTGANGAFLPRDVRDWAFGDVDYGPDDDKLLDKNGDESTAIQMNDVYLYKFPEIATSIRTTFGV